MRPASPSVLLQSQSLPALLVTDPLNVRFLTGVKTSLGYLLVTPKAFTLCLDPRYLEEAGQTAMRGITLKPVADLPALLSKLPRCGYESAHVTVDQLLRWKKRFGDTQWVRAKGVVEECRRQKDEREIRYLKRAERITWELLRRVPAVLRGSLTELELAWKLRVWAQDLGAEAMAFDPVVAFGTHTSHMHHHPTSRPLKKGHIVQLDVGVRYNGYCADLAEVYFTAKPTPMQAAAYATVREALDASLARIRPGVRNTVVDEAARTILRRDGVEQLFGHALGHGVGLDVHEGPTLCPAKRGTKLLEGEVFAVEPGVYYPGKFGIRLERMVYLGEPIKK